MSESESAVLEHPDTKAEPVSFAGSTPPGSSHAVPEVTYTPDGHLGLGLAAWRQMVQELIASRELTWRFFLRDFSARYSQSVLGYIWAVIPALVTTATFTFLNRSKVLPIAGTELPYPVFVLLSMTIWQLFSSGLTSTTQSLVTAGNLITKINFPKETLVLSAFYQSLFEFLIRAALVLLSFVLYHVTPAWTVALVPLAMIPLCLFTLGLGFVLSLVNGIMRDAGQMVTFVLTFWMFLTPVVYPATGHASRSLIAMLNPVSPFVIAAQDLTSKGYMTRPEAYMIGSVASLLIFLLGWRIFHLTEPRIAERV